MTSEVGAAQDAGASAPAFSGTAQFRCNTTRLEKMMMIKSQGEIVKWSRITPKYATKVNGKPQHHYEADTDHGKFILLHRNNTRNGRTFKYKVWILWVDGRPVSGSKRYYLRDAKTFAERHLSELAEKAAQKEARCAKRHQAARHGNY